MQKRQVGILVVSYASNAKVTEICTDLTPDWASGERRPIADRSANKVIRCYYSVILSLLGFSFLFSLQFVLAGPISI